MEKSSTRAATVRYVSSLVESTRSAGFVLKRHLIQYLGALPPNTMIAHLLLLFPGIWQNLSYFPLYVRYMGNWLRSRSHDKASLVSVVCYVSWLVG